MLTPWNPYRTLCVILFRLIGVRFLEILKYRYGSSIYTLVLLQI
ncbi:hypothetical protein VPHK481_0101 [Vibrio phage K481]